MQNLSKNFWHFHLTYSQPPSPAPWEPWRSAVFQPPSANNSLTKTREGTLGLKSLKKLQPQSIDTIWPIAQQVEKAPRCSIFLLFDLISSSFQRKRSILIVSVKNNQWKLFAITASWGSDTTVGNQEPGQNFTKKILGMRCPEGRHKKALIYFWGFRGTKSCAGLCTSPGKTSPCTYLLPLSDLEASVSRKWRLGWEL